MDNGINKRSVKVSLWHLCNFREAELLKFTYHSLTVFIFEVDPKKIGDTNMILMIIIGKVRLSQD